jgi:hypothetical protein
VIRPIEQQGANHAQNNNNKKKTWHESKQAKPQAKFESPSGSGDIKGTDFGKEKHDVKRSESNFWARSSKFVFPKF